MSVEVFIGGAIVGGFVTGFYAILLWASSKRQHERQEAYEILGQILTDKDVLDILKKKELI